MRRESVPRKHPRPRPLAGGFFAAVFGSLLAGMLGCSSRPNVVRPQSAEESERDRYPVKTVGDVLTFGNVEPMPVSGVGLIEGLDGTGGPAPTGSYRQMLENDLRKQRVDKVKEVLNSKDCALVLVSGLIPPGARKDDVFDVEITLPPGSRATSLRGGYPPLRAVQLRLRPQLQFAPGQFRRGSQGPSGRSGAGTFAGRLRRRCGRAYPPGPHLGRRPRSIDRPFHLVLNSNEAFARVANNVIGRVNAAFQDSLPGGPGTEIAFFRNKSTILVAVPPQTSSTRSTSCASSA